MPISRINPDGTVNIYNSKTGEVRTGIAPEQLGSISPNLVSAYYEMQQPQAQLERAEAEQALEQIESGEIQQEPVSAADAKLHGSLTSGLTSVDRIESTLDTNPEKEGLEGGGGKLFGATTPFTPWSKGLESDMLNVADAVLRMRTGAAAPETEVKRYARILMPTVIDPPKVRQQKLETARLELETAAKALGLDPEDIIGKKKEELGTETTETQGLASEAVGFQTIEPGSEGVTFAPEPEMEEEKSLSGLGENALSDVQENIQGILAIPQLVFEISQNPSMAPEVGKAIVTGVIDEYKNLITHPLETSYDHPVNTVLNVIPLIPIGKAGMARFAGTAGKADDVALASRVVQGTIGMSDEAAIAGKVLDTGDNFTDVARVAQKATQKTAPSLRSQIAAKTYSSAFIVPTKRAKSLNPKAVSAKMLDYGVSGNFDDMRKTANTVTGSNGVLSKVTRNAIGDIQGEVDVGKVLPSVKNTLDDIVDLTPTEEQRIMTNIIKAQTPGQEIGKMNPLDAYDLAKRLEAQGHQHLNTSTYLTKNMKAEGIGKAYLNAAKEIMDEVENMVKGQDAVSAYKNPEVLAQLEAVSPKLADEFRQASTLSEVRSLQAPFVKLNQMIDLTEQAANSAFQSTGRQVAGKMGSALVGGAAGTPLGPLGQAVGAGAGLMFGPQIEAVIEATRPVISTRMAKMIGGTP